MLAEVHPNIYCCFEWNSLSNQQPYDLNSIIITISSDENSEPWSEVLIILLLSYSLLQTEVKHWLSHLKA